MRLRWVSWSLLFVGLSCSTVVVLTPQEQADVTLVCGEPLDYDGNIDVGECTAPPP